MAVSFMAEILPMFRQVDIDHMKPFDVLLDDYDYMANPAGGVVGKCASYPDHTNARSVFGYLRGDCLPRMPLGGPFWSQDQLDLYEQWMNEGFAP